MSRYVAWRGHSLMVEKSHLRVREVVLRCPLTLQTLHSHNSLREAEEYCRRNGYSIMEPVADVDQAGLEERI